jgi:hypothetical protein
MDQERRKSNKKPKSQTSDHPVYQTGLSSFPRIDRVRVGFEILFVYERFDCIRLKELCPATYINIGHDRF